MSKPSIFISYSRKDSSFIDTLEADLTSAGFETWIDREGLRTGTSWEEQLRQAIIGRDIFLIVVSPDSMASEYVSDEVSFAMSIRKPIFPVVFRKVEDRTKLNMRINRLQTSDFTKKEYAEALADLIDSLNYVANEIEATQTQDTDETSLSTTPLQQPYSGTLVAIQLAYLGWQAYQGYNTKKLKEKPHEWRGTLPKFRLADLPEATPHTITVDNVEQVTGTTVFDNHSGVITFCAMSPDGRYFVTVTDGLRGFQWMRNKWDNGSQDRYIRIWDVATQKLLKRLPASSDILDIDFTPDSTTLVIVEKSGSIKFMDIATQTIAASIRENGKFESFTMSSTEFVFATSIKKGVSREIQLWLFTGEYFEPFWQEPKSKQEPASPFAFSSNLSSLDGFVLERKPSIFNTKPDEKHEVIALSHDNRHFAYRVGDDVYVIDIETYTIIHTKTLRELESYRGGAFSSLDSAFYCSTTSSGSRGEIYKSLYRIPTDEGDIKSLSGYEHFAKSVTPTPNGDMLIIVAHRDLVFWDVEQQKVIHKIEDSHKDTINDVIISADGTTIATVSNDKSVKFWRI